MQVVQAYYRAMQQSGFISTEPLKESLPSFLSSFSDLSFHVLILSVLSVTTAQIFCSFSLTNSSINVK